MSYGLTAGLRFEEMRSMTPGMVLDMFVYRRRYDDVMHHISRKKDHIYD